MMKIEELNLSVRAYNVLKRAGINTVEQICEYSAWELSRLRNMGAKTLEEIRDKVLAAGFNAFGLIAPPPSNGDKLRRSSDEELAEFIFNLIGNINAYDGACILPNGHAVTTVDGILNWLKSPSAKAEPHDTGLPY